MSTPKAALRLAIEIESGFGEIFPVTSLTTTTIVSDSLKMGEPASKYANKYAVRRDAASSADRIRQITEFNGSTGTLTHAGANYSDTTPTNEYVEIYEQSPIMVDQFVQQVPRICRRHHRDIIPAHGGAEYLLDQYAWIEHRGHVQRLLWNGSPVLGRNVYFRDRNVVSTAGALEPDEWTKTNGTWAWSATNPYRAPYGLTVTRSSSTVTVEQFVGGGGAYRSALGDGVDDMAGETFGVMLVGLIGTASSLRPFVNDGSGKDYGSYHTGGSTYEELTNEITVGATPTQLSFGFEMDVDATATIGACLAYRGAISDAVRRDVYHGQSVAFGWRDRPPMVLPNYRAGRGASYVLESWRPYPALDNTRLLAGNADADESDMPVDLWAYGILALSYRALQGNEGPEAVKYAAAFERLRGASQWSVTPHRYARPPLGPPVRRF